ncbi:glycosyltransferase [Geofilum rhodophaeum]|uniref:glycosyltransferase n=1 Tax=Geofilum rhodophaeum TaxID=1965019 RepID=UPI000B524F4F|nr:glycosyltransferase [Geofilum rhodophaeum]
MRVLWFTNTSSLFGKSSSSYNGGGWISSLESELRKVEGVELGLAFFHPDEFFKVRQNESTYYPISAKAGFLGKIRYKFCRKKRDSFDVLEFLKVVDDFKPDVIHIFGSERSFGLIKEKTHIPVVLHLQGILNPYLNAWFPPGYSFKDLFCTFNLPYAVRLIKSYLLFKESAFRESKILSSIEFFLGRTKWDEQLTKLYSPNSRYFYGSEILRDVFYKAEPWSFKEKGCFVITTTISEPLYKGLDLVLKTAKILKYLRPSFLFQWNVYGNVQLFHAERKNGIHSEEVNISCEGVVTAEVLVQRIQDSDLFVHPSYIDNSPNSVCEAQYLGIPVVATNVGGVSSLIDNEVTGILTPANDPFSMAATIIELSEDSQKMAVIGAESRRVAIRRHDKKSIVNSLIEVYDVLQHPQ